MTKPIVNPSPKQRFQRTQQNITNHRDLLEMPAFILACDAALLEYQRQVSSQAKSMESAAAAGWRVLGAQELLSVLRRLAETEAPQSKPTTGLNLEDLQ